MELKTDFDSKYRRVHVAARRARQIQSGAAPLVPTTSTKASKVAQDEVRAGKVDYHILEQPESALTPILNEFAPVLHTSLPS